MRRLTEKLIAEKFARSYGNIVQCNALRARCGIRHAYDLQSQPNKRPLVVPPPLPKH